MTLNNKHIFDITIISFSLVIWLPLIILITLATKYFIGSPIIFQQCRLGLHGKPFVIYKFRTMLDKRNTQGELLADPQRLTWLGRWLRSTSLDELPQLWNVCRGEMSLVGPRPLLLEELPDCPTIQAKRHAVPPGITGWAQINGRNTLSVQEKLAFDLWYVEHQSLWLDCKILLLTIKPVLLRQNI
jgi:sugar transferase EpsL